VNLFVKLPLECEVDDTAPSYPTPTPDNPSATTSYKKLKLAMLEDMSTNTDDLFGREPGAATDDDIFRNIKSVAVKFYGYNNSATDGLALGVINGGTTQVISLDNGTSAPAGITLDNIDNPFTPKFELLVPVEAGSSTLKILRPVGGKKPVIDFSIAVQASMDLDQTIKF
jgi:hypothetical protein